MEQLSLSIVLPVSGETPELAAAVVACLELGPRHSADVEIIIADAGGDGQTSAVADRLASTHAAVALIRYQRRRGYRQTLYDAWGVARGAYVGALDLRGPASVADLARLLPAAREHAAILGYRVPPAHDLATMLFTRAVGASVGAGIRDPALGLGLFRADLRPLLTPDGTDALAHASLYAAAHAQGLAVTQMAVAGSRRRASRPSLADLSTALGQSSPGDSPAPPLARRDAAMGAGLVVIACGLWLLRRFRRTA